MEPTTEMIQMMMQRMGCDADTAVQALRQLATLMTAEAPLAPEAKVEKSRLGGPDWLEGWRTMTTLGPATDDLVDHYSALADDTSKGGKKREAAMLFSVAEGHINDQEADAALKSSREALALYRNHNDKVALADTIRLVINAYRLKADTARWSPDQDAAEEAFKEADELAREELANFQDKDKRSEAAMLLSLAELNLDNMQNLDQSMEFVQKAVNLFHDEKDKKMEALASLVAAQVFCKKHKYREVVDSANQAILLSKDLGDKKGQAKALHMLAVAHASSHNLQQGITCGNDALKLHKETDNKTAMVLEMVTVAHLYLEQDKPHDALKCAQDALETSKEIKKGKGWLAAAEQAVVEAYLNLNEVKKALEVAAKSVERCQLSGDKREEVYAQTTLAYAQLAGSEPEEAVNAAESAVELCQDLRDRSWEGKTSVTLAEVHCELGDYEAAQKHIQDAVEIFQDDGDKHHEAIASAILSRVLIFSGEIEDGLQAAEKGRAIFHDIEEKDHEAIALLTLANAYSEKGKSAEALAAAKQSIEIAKAMDHKQGEAYGLSMVAKVHQKCEEFPKALEHAKQARRLWYVMGNTGAEAEALNQIARIHLDKFESKSTLRAVDAAEKICRKNGYAGLLTYALLTATEAHVQAVSFGGGASGAAAKALGTVSEAVRIADSVGIATLRASANFWWAQVLLLNDGAQDAVNAASTARVLYRQCRDSPNEGQALLMLARAYMQMKEGHKESAIRAADDAMEIFQECKDDAGEESAKEILYKLGALGMRMMPPGMVPLEGGAPVSTPNMDAQAQSVAAAKPKGLNPEMVSQTVQEMAKAAIGLDDAVYLDSPLMDSGMDSLTAVSFRNGLQQNLGVKLPSSLMFDYPTMKEVANRIVELSLEE